jgi:hypothetical protein
MAVGVVVVLVLVQLHPVLPDLLPDELLVDEGGAPELRQHQPRHEQQLHLVPYRYPATRRNHAHGEYHDQFILQKSS